MLVAGGGLKSGVMLLSGIKEYKELAVTIFSLKSDMVALLLGIGCGLFSGYIFWDGGYIIIFFFAFLCLPTIFAYAEHHKFAVWQLSIIIPAVCYAAIWYLQHKNQLSLYDYGTFVGLKEKVPQLTFDPDGKYKWYKSNIFDPAFYFWLSSVILSLPLIILLWLRQRKEYRSRNAGA